MSKVKAVFRGVTPEQKEKFKDSTCLLTISVGQEYHEGEKLEAILTLINTSFKSFSILLGDTLQRYTIALNDHHAPEYFHSTTLMQGEEWLKRNEPSFKKLTGFQNVIRWDAWLKDPLFIEKETLVKKKLALDKSYQEKFEVVVTNYLKKYICRLSEPEKFDYNRAYQLCFKYILEECIALCLWCNTDCDYEIYPSQRNLAMDETHKRFVVPEYGNRLYSVALKFKHKEKHNSQVFIEM